MFATVVWLLARVAVYLAQKPDTKTYIQTIYLFIYI